MITIAVTNQKGGTGKTTTAVTMAHKFALDGRDVLLVDTDTQGHCAKSLGLDPQPGILSVVDWKLRGKPILIVHGVRSKDSRISTMGRFDLLPSDKSTAAAKVSMAGMGFREGLLAEALESLSGRYDVAVIDCAPSVDVLHTAALVAADLLVIPTQFQFLSLAGVNEALRSILDVPEGSRPSLLGILGTFWERVTKETALRMKQLRQSRLAPYMLPMIPKDINLSRAPGRGMTIWEYDPTTRGVVGVELNGGNKRVGGYLQFMERVEGRLS